MSITVFQDLVFRHGVISAAFHARLIRRNQRVPLVSGFENINIVWDRTKREYTFGSIPLQRADFDYISSFYENTDAGAYGFLMEDPIDFHSTSATQYTQTSGRVADLGGGTYQAFKRYTNIASARYKDRKITRPNIIGFQLYLGGVLQSGGYSVDGTTGIITIASAPSAAAVEWRGRFYVPVHFQSDDLDINLDVPGPDDFRMFSAPTVVFQEIWE